MSRPANLAAQTTPPTRRAILGRLLGGIGIAALAGCDPARKVRSGALALEEGESPTHPAAPGIFDVTAFGATADGSTDDSPAIQAAVSAAVAAGGGTIFFPNGRYRVCRTITSVAEASSDPSLYFIGTGASVLLLDTPGSISFYGGNQGFVTFKQLIVVGYDQDRLYDCLAGFYYGYLSSLIFEECRFLGIGSELMLVNSNAGLEIRNCTFMGCASPNSAMVFMGHYDSWRHAEISGSYFIDFGSFGGTFYSKTPRGVQAWIGTGNAATARGANSSSTLRVLRCGFDEGAGWVLAMQGLGGRARVDVEDCSSLMNACTGTGVLGFNNAFARVRGYSFDPKDNTASNAVFVKATNCPSLVIEQCSRIARSNPSRIVASSDCGSVQVIDSDYDEIVSEAAVTLGQDAGVRWKLRKTEGAVTANTMVAVGSSPGRVCSISPSAMRRPIGVALDSASAAGEQVRVVEEIGQQVQILADTASVAAGTGITLSPMAAGRMTSQSEVGAHIFGTATSTTEGGSMDQLIDVIWCHGVV